MAGTCRDIYDACEKGKKEEVERFIRAGVGVNEKDNFGTTPIHLAAWGGYTDLVKLLLENGAEETKDDQGLTAKARARKEQRSDALAIFRDFENW